MMERVAIVTGSGRGIGADTAQRLAAQGLKVVVNDLSDARLERIQDEIRASGGTCFGIAADVAKRDQAQHLIDRSLDRFGRVDILVNNVGFARDAPFIEMSQESWEFVLQGNLTSAFNCAQAAAPAMIRQGWGRIVNVSSIAYMGKVEQVNYSAAKAGLIGLTRCIAKELAQHQITANCVVPGAIATSGLERFLANKEPEHRRRLSDQALLKRLGRPGEVAAAIAFLASEDASFITAEVLHVTGGWLA